jgi:hypothetical protein
MAMRNYSAMLDAKLMRCIDELENGYGDACQRVNLQTKWPANSIEENLRVASEVAAARGLKGRGPTPKRLSGTVRPSGPPVPAFEPEPPKPKCRGCAGTGVDHTVHARLLQVAEGPWLIGPKSGAKRGTFKHVVLGEAPKRNDYGGGPRSANQIVGKPLALMLPLLAKARDEGREIQHLPTMAEVPFPLGKEHACTWCHGTGEPQLSTEVLQERIDAS